MENQKDDKDFIAAPSPTEDVVEKPPRARVSDAPLPEEETAGEKLGRKRDYLEGFLQKKPESVSSRRARRRSAPVGDRCAEGYFRSGNPGEHL